MIDVDQKIEYLKYAEEILKVPLKPEFCRWITNLSIDGSILGVVVYSCFTNHSCELSAASSSCYFWSRSFAKAVYSYAFDKLKYTRLTAIIRVNNERSQRFATDHGFILEGRLKNWYPDSDGFIYGMLREDCKWVH